MTGKRFLKGYHTIRDKKENKIYDFRIENVLFLLNELDEKYVDEYALRETLQVDLQRVEKENEQLKTKNNAYLQDIETLKEENTTLKLENEWLKEENQELHRLNHEEVESWSDEKKQMIADFSNLMFGDKINDRKKKNNWKSKY